MVYRIQVPGGILAFSWNCGRLFIEAKSPEEAVALARRFFEPIRNVSVSRISDTQLLVEFRVQHDYRSSLLKSIDRAVRTIVNPQFYKDARVLDRYLLACVRRLSGKPAWLEIADLKEEISALRKAAIAAGEAPGIEAFRDWDICLANWAEMNMKEGHRSRSIRIPRQFLTS